MKVTHRNRCVVMVKLHANEADAFHNMAKKMQYQDVGAFIHDLAYEKLEEILKTVIEENKKKAESEKPKIIIEQSIQYDSKEPA